MTFILPIWPVFEIISFFGLFASSAFRQKTFGRGGSEEVSKIPEMLLK
jgi:hypothetical protein